MKHTLYTIGARPLEIKSKIPPHIKKNQKSKNLILISLLTILANTAFASDFFWNINTGAQGASPRKACEDQGKAQTSYPRHRNYVITELTKIDETRFTCRFTYETQHQTNLTWHTKIAGPYTIRRRGSTCPSGTTYDTENHECLNPNRLQKGPFETCPTSITGNPINFAIGNKTQKETDLTNTPLGFDFTRTYNSIDGIWRHSLSTHLRITGKDQFISLVFSHGRESTFTIEEGIATETSNELGKLSKTDGGWRFLSIQNELFNFDTNGNLTEWSNTNGTSQQLVRNGNQVTVTDTLGNSLLFTEDADRQPLSMTAPGVQITYSYNANKRLTSASRTAGGVTTERHYHYEDPRNNALLTGITDERGVRYATWSYDEQGRAISSEHADGAERVTVAYNSNGTVSVTNELGKVANYSFQYIKGVKRITAIEGEPSPNCPSSNSTFTYDERGLLKTKTDNKGHLTTYTYNSRGLEISRTEAASTPQARTITTDWHADLFLPVTVTEPDRITQYTYDNHGRQISQTVTQR